MTGPHLVTTPAAPTLCPRCRALILVGAAEGQNARADPTTLDPAAEVTALLAGRTTYSITVGGELVIRTESRIRGRMPGPVLAEHNCPRPAPTNPPY